MRDFRDPQHYVSDALERLYSDYLWHLAEAAQEAGLAVEDGWFVFVNLVQEPRFAPMRPETVYAKVERLRRRVGCLPEGWTPHWLRHTHATALQTGGIAPDASFDRERDRWAIRDLGFAPLLRAP